jgi:Phage P22-like portal protein
MAQDPLQPQVGSAIKFPAQGLGENRATTPEAGNAKTVEGDGAKKLSAADKRKLLARARKRFERAARAEADNRKAGLDDLKFMSGEAQWPSDVAAQRNFDRRPCLTVNAVPTFVHQVCNDLRQNRPSINVSPVGDRGDREVARFYRGLIRSIERTSHADIAYDTAAWNMVGNGWGYLRLATEYEDADTFDQTLVIRRVRNPFTIYMDPDAQEPTGIDSLFGFVSEMIPKDEFEELYPDAAVLPWLQTGTGEKSAQWGDTSQVRVAEYFEVEKKARTLVALDNGHVGWEDELHDLAREALKRGRLQVVKRRTSFERKVNWYKITAMDVLEVNLWPGSYIPIVRMPGQEIDIEGKVKLAGLVRAAKDPQRILNYAKTAEVEATMLAPKAPYIMEEGQLEGHENEWRQANVKNFSVLTYKGTSVSGKPAPPPQRVPVAPIPAGIVNMQQGAAQDLQRTTGIRFDATINERMTDESGRAIRELRRNGDLGSFHYADNMARALRHLGDMMVELIPKIYDTPRMVTILRDDDTEEQVRVDPTAPKPSMEVAGADPMRPKTKIFNPTVGKYGVTVTIGPSYATKRIEAAESMMRFATAMPATAQLIADLIAKNMDWEGADEMARRLAKAVPAQFMAPDRKDMSPQVQAAMLGMEQQIKQLTQELRVAQLQLNDKSADRAVMADKINKDFEAKLLAIVQKAEAVRQKEVGGAIRDLADDVTSLMAALQQPQQPMEMPANG